MKKVITSTVLIVAFILYSVFSNKTNSTPAALPVVTSQNNSSTTNSIGETATPTQTITTTTGLKDGEYIGPATDAFYGNIQVKAVIQNGKLTDVQFLQYPNDHRESIEINSRALPILRQEAIAQQSANVDSVTRATDSSNAFIQSLSAALSQAKS